MGNFILRGVRAKLYERIRSRLVLASLCLAQFYLRQLVTLINNLADEGRKTKDYQNMISVMRCVTSMMPQWQAVLYPPLVGSMGREAF